MKIAIDLNDVIRDYTDNFIRVYLTNYNREYDTDNLELWTNDMSSVLPFKTDRVYEKFVYEDFVYDLYGKVDNCNNKIQPELKEWLKNTNNEVMFVSTREYGLSVPYTYFYVSKLGCPIREIYMPVDSLDIWDKCDLLITANPMLIENKPEDKKVIRIVKEYNKECKADYSFPTINEFFMFYNENENLFE